MKKKYAFPYAKNAQWMDRLNYKEIKCYKLFPHSLLTGNILYPAWFKSGEAQQMKENKAKAVRSKAACHVVKSMITFFVIWNLKKLKHHIPVSYINIQGIKELCSGDIKYLKELVEDNVIDE